MNHFAERSASTFNQRVDGSIPSGLTNTFEQLGVISPPRGKKHSNTLPIVRCIEIGGAYFRPTNQGFCNALAVPVLRVRSIEPILSSADYRRRPRVPEVTGMKAGDVFEHDKFRVAIREEDGQYFADVQHMSRPSTGAGVSMGNKIIVGPCADADGAADRAKADIDQKNIW